MKKHYTTKILYSAGNSCCGNYAPSNCKPYGTKWKVRGYWDGYNFRSISAICLITNWTINENKINDETFC